MTDSDAEGFYARTYPRLWAYLVRTTRERELAEEIAQESFVRLFASRGVVLPEVERRAYLFRIAENLVRDTIERRARERTTPLGSIAEPPAPAPFEPIGTHVAEALAALGERDRKLLWLAYVEEWSHREIANVLGVGTASVKVLLHRARHRFQQLLEGSKRHEQ
jgi:RNA polymerase sigma-70 factor (ECF subfamily)